MKYFSLLSVLLGITFASSAQAQVAGDLTITAGSALRSGNQITYSYTVQNNSPTETVFLFANMTEPSGFEFLSSSESTCADDPGGVIQCNPVTIAANTSVEYTFTLEGTLLECSSYPFAATVFAMSGSDENAGNNTAYNFFNISCSSSSSSSPSSASSSSFSSSSSSSSSSSAVGGDLGISVISTPFTHAGGDLTYSFTVQNTASGPAEFLFANMIEPAGFEFLQSNIGNCSDDAGGTIQCDPINIPGNTTVTYEFTFSTQYPDNCGDTSFTANILLFPLNIPGYNNSGSNDTAVANGFVSCDDLRLTSSINTTSPQAGDTVVITYTLENLGNRDMDDVFVSIVLPSNLVLETATPSNGTMFFDPLSWQVPTLLQGETTQLVIVARVPADAPNTVFELSASVLMKVDVNNSNNTTNLEFTSTTASVVSTGGGGGGGRRSGGLPSASFGGLAEAGFGGLEEAVTTEELQETCLAFEALDPVFSDVSTNTYLSAIELWGQTSIAATGERLITGFGNHSTMNSTVPAFVPTAKVTRLQAAKMILVSHCISIPATIPVPADGFEFADLPHDTPATDAARYFAARVFYTAYNNGVVRGQGGTIANPNAEATFAEVLAMMLRLDQPQLVDGSAVWYSTYLDFAQRNDLGMSLDVASTMQRDFFVDLMTRSILAGTFTQVIEYVQTHL